MRDFLQYRPLQDSSAQALVGLLREAGQLCGVAAIESHFLRWLQECAYSHPEVQAALDGAALLAPPERAEKKRRCAYLGCEVSSEGLLTTLKK